MRGPGRLLLLALTVHALPEVPRSNSTLNLTCFGWRLVPPELILTHEGAYLHGVAINESELQAIRHVTADLVVVDDFWLKDLSSLANLERVGGNVEIRYTMRLENISGLSNLEVIGGSLNIFFNRGLKHIEGFTKLQVVGRALRVNHNDLLESITGFPKLVRIGQDFTLRGNGQLLAAPSMPSLRAIGGDVEVIFNSILTMDHMVSALESIDGNFLIKDNDNLTNLTLLPNVTKIGKTFELSFNHGITELHGPPQLHQLGALTIKSNPSLKIVDGFDSLRSLCCEKDFKKDDVPGDFAVMFNTQLLDMSFPELQAVRDFTVIDNDNLTEAWFPSLWSVAGDVQVSYNAQLRSFRSATSAADSVSFLANFQLTEVAMPNLSRVLKGGMAISFNMELEYLNNFSALRQVSGDLQIKGNRRLKDIRTFEELRQVTGNVLVENNTDLTDISGLSSALVVGGNLELSKNDQLQRISGLESLPKVLGFSVWSINCSGNAVHPMNATRCESCTQWEMPSVDGRRCLLNWSFILVVGVTYAFAFCLASVVCMTLRTAMVVDAIIISSNGRILLRATERHYLLRGFWGRSFPIYVQGTGCDFLDRQEPIRARAVSDVELELLVRVEKFNRRTLSSLPLSEVSFQRTVDSAMGFNKTDGSCVLSCEGFAVLRSPWELLTVGLCMPSLVWALGFALAIGGLVVLCSSLDPAMPWDFLLLNAAQSASLGSALALLLRLLAVLRRRRQRRKRRVELREVQLMGQLEQASWDGDEAAILAVHKELAERGWSQQRLKANLRELRCKQSQEAGVSVAYLLSSEFFQLSEARSGKDDPDFYDLKDAFFLQGEPIGGEEICPRDGRRGCAMVDVLRREHRRQCTHFLSWAWCYQVSVVRSAMRSWMDQSKLEPSKTFLYMCFFVNNQYRILLDQQGAGSRDFSLGEVFEENLQRVGRMVALLDHWDQPSYLSRIWTIFEQYSAVVLEIEVTFILPQASGESLLQEIRKGEQGILAVRESLCTVDAETASAWCLEDERHVKRVIEQSIGFEKVNEKVQELMIAWVATMVKDYLGNLVVLGTRRLQRQRARTLLSVPASTEVTNKLSSRTEVSVGTMQTIRVKHTDSIWSQYMQNESTTH